MKLKPIAVLIFIMVLLVSFSGCLTNDISEGNPKNVVIAIDSENNVHAVWYDQETRTSSNDAIFYKKIDKNGTELQTLKIADKTKNFINPRIVIDSMNDANVFYILDSKESKIYFAKINKTGILFNKELNITSNSKGEITLAINQKDEIFLFIYFTDKKQYLYFNKIDSNGSVLISKEIYFFGYVDNIVALNNTIYTHFGEVGSYQKFRKYDENGTDITPLDYNSSEYRIFWGHPAIEYNGKYYFLGKQGNFDSKGNLHTVSYYYRGKKGNEDRLLYSKINKNGTFEITNEKIAQKHILEEDKISLKIDSEDNVYISATEDFSYDNDYSVFYIKLDNNGNVITTNQFQNPPSQEQILWEKSCLIIFFLPTIIGILLVIYLIKRKK